MSEPRGRPLGERFWGHVDKSGDCWLWTKRIDPYGYGKVSIAKKSCLAHRVAYELTIGPIPTGLTIDHLCRNRACVNPAHLEAVSLAENGRRAMTRPDGRCLNGHERTPDNLYEYRGYLRCRQCNRDAVRRYKTKGRPA